ncbi:SecY interacting protein Syd [Enterobacter cloacae]|uniref:SecY interacting protein Syd n=1 Tax=Enterobacter cloacae TaxID=550 RepID=A0A377LVD5_ENTCL|nr:SecY interacting protein Syd [Enterobacter cloacae]
MTPGAPGRKVLISNGVPSPCIISSVDDYVIWQPQPWSVEENVNAVERQWTLWYNQRFTPFYTTQFAGICLPALVR